MKTKKLVIPSYHTQKPQSQPLQGRWARVSFTVGEEQSIINTLADNISNFINTKGKCEHEGKKKRRKGKSHYVLKEI